MPIRNLNTILLTEHVDTLARLRLALREPAAAGVLFELARDLPGAISMLKERGADLLFLDLSCQRFAWADGIREIRTAFPRVPVVALAKTCDERLVAEVVQAGALDVITPDHLNGAMVALVVHHAVERFRILDELEETRSRLEKLALVDPITGLLNRQGLEQAFLVETRRAHREVSELLVVRIDLDDFTRINDTLGHAAGDIVLMEVARKLRSVLRVTDHVGRLEKDNFLVFLPKTRWAEGIQVAEKMRLSLSVAPIELTSGNVHLTASLGVMAVTREIPSLDPVLTQTGLAVEMSKKAGKNQVAYAGMVQDGVNRDEPLYEILDALRRGQGFRAKSQGLYALADETKIGYEMLCRGPVGTFEMPDDFFRLSSEKNILTLVDHMCLKTCIAAGARLEPGMRIHVNLFPSTMLAIPTPYLLSLFPGDRPKSDFCIEISEQQIIGDPSYLLKPITALRKAGIEIAIDDVGFGRSCLESLIILEPEIVKIDRKWINGIFRDEKQARSLKRFLKVAEGLDSRVVAEGVETREDLETLQSLGVEFGQGYLWGKPA
ncbi:MAG: EAL domain-containing protein [Planctomycetota bacterium]